MKKMKNWALKLFIVNGIINYCELHVLQTKSKSCQNQKLTRKSPQQDFTYVFLIASYRRFTAKLPQVFTIHFLPYSKVFESSWEGHHKVVGIYFS